MPETETKVKMTSYQKLVLALSCLTIATISLDYFGFTIALPVIGREFQLSTAQIGWIMNSNQLAFAATIIGMGRLADLIGRVKMMIVGCVTFGTGALISASAPGYEILLLGRAVVGIAGAIIAVTGLAVLTSVFERNQRNSAIGVLTASGLGAGIFGPFLSGYFTQYLDWRWFFVIDGVLAVICFVLLLVFLKEPKKDKTGERLDLIGFVAMGAGLVLVIFALDGVDKSGWFSPIVIGSMVAGVILLVSLYFIEKKVRDPLIDFTLFGDRDFLGGCLVMFFSQMPSGALMMFLTLYLQHVLGFSPLWTGVVFLASMIPGTAVSLASGPLTRIAGGRAILAASRLLVILGFVCFGFSRPTSGVEIILVGLLLFGIGQTLVVTAASGIVMAAAPVNKSGSASGVLKSVRAIGASVGLAIGGGVFRTAEHNRLNRLYELAGNRLSSDQQSEIREMLAGSDAARLKLQSIAPDLLSRTDIVINDAYAHAFRDVMFLFIAVSAIAFMCVFVIRPDPEPEREALKQPPDILPEKTDPDENK